MLPGYGDSFTVWCSPTPGTVLWPFKFKDGYIDREYVRMRYMATDGAWNEVKINPKTSFAADYTLKVEPAIPPCLMVEVYRDTPKDKPIVVYGRGGMLLLEESRNAAARQSMHIFAELKEYANRSDLQCLCECVEAGT